MRNKPAEDVGTSEEVGVQAEFDAESLTEKDVVSLYGINATALYELRDAHLKTGVNYSTVRSWATNHNALHSKEPGVIHIAGEALILYIRLRRWESVARRNRLVGLPPLTPIPIPKQYATRLQGRRGGLDNPHKRGRLSRADKEKETRLAQTQNREIWLKMTPTQSYVSFTLGIIPHKMYTSTELSLTLGISQVKFWVEHEKLRREMIGKLQHILGYDYIFFYWKRDDPGEQARAQQEEERARERRRRKELPRLTPAEYKITREYRIRPKAFYEFRDASGITGIPIISLKNWAARLNLIECIPASKDRHPALKLVGGRHIIFYLFERQWKKENDERRKNGEPVPRYPSTPTCYQTDAYKDYISRIEYREDLNQRADKKLEAKKQTILGQREKVEKWKAEEMWRQERQIATDFETKERYTINEVAVLAHRERKTIERRIDKGWLKKVKIGRAVFVEHSEVMSLLATNGQPWLGCDDAEKKALPSLSPEEARIARKHHISSDLKYSLSDAAHRARTTPNVLSSWMFRANPGHFKGCKGGIWGRHIIAFIAEKSAKKRVT